MILTKEILGIIIATVTMFATLISFFYAIRIELRKNSEHLIQSHLLDEKRHSSHLQRMAIIEERMTNVDSIITLRLDEIQRRISEIKIQFYEHLKERHQ